VLEKWNKLTPLARNEWICYVTIPKKIEIRNEHLVRVCEDIRGGQKDLVAGQVVHIIGQMQLSGLTNLNRHRELSVKYF